VISKTARILAVFGFLTKKYERKEDEKDGVAILCECHIDSSQEVWIDGLEFCNRAKNCPHKSKICKFRKIPEEEKHEERRRIA
jgi:hypothetical protein